MILIQHDNIYESSKIPKPKGVIRSQKLKRTTMAKRTKIQTMVNR
jgi:hypothetical protein